MMGYTIHEADDFAVISLETDKGMIVKTAVTFEELEQTDFIVELLVGRLNNFIIQNS